jgi:putative aminopeptidase FrvX
MLKPRVPSNWKLGFKRTSTRWVFRRGTDAGRARQHENGGDAPAATIPISIPPIRTSPCTIINRADLDRTVNLLVAVLAKLDSKTVLRLRDFAPAP